MRCSGTDRRKRSLYIVKRTAAARAGDVLGAGHPHAGRLQDHQLDLRDLLFRKVRRVDPNAVRQPVQKERPQIGSGFDGDGFDRRIVVAAAHRDGFVGPVEAQDRGPQFGRGILRQGFDHPPVGRQLGVNQGSLHPSAAAVSRRRITLRIFDGELPLRRAK